MYIMAISSIWRQQSQRSVANHVNSLCASRCACVNLHFIADFTWSACLQHFSTSSTVKPFCGDPRLETIWPYRTKVDNLEQTLHLIQWISNFDAITPATNWRAIYGPLCCNVYGNCASRTINRVFRKTSGKDLRAKRTPSRQLRSLAKHSSSAEIHINVSFIRVSRFGRRKLVSAMLSTALSSSKPRKRCTYRAFPPKWGCIVCCKEPAISSKC